MDSLAGMPVDDSPKTGRALSCHQNPVSSIVAKHQNTDATLLIMCRTWENNNISVKDRYFTEIC
eukprot:scaffold456151_cov15-Prasinocladus_malaysianus.AAC.1